MVTQVRCPTCKKMTVWSADNQARPFCTARCKEIDLGAWASDAYVVEGASPSTAQEFDLLEQALQKQLGSSD